MTSEDLGTTEDKISVMQTLSNVHLQRQDYQMASAVVSEMQKHFQAGRKRNPMGDALVRDGVGGGIRALGPRKTARKVEPPPRIMMIIIVVIIIIMIVMIVMMIIIMIIIMIIMITFKKEKEI